MLSRHVRRASVLVASALAGNALLSPGMMTTVVFADGGQHAEPHHHQQEQQPSYYYEQYVSPSTAPVSYTPREGLASSSDFALDDGFNTVTHDEFMAATEKPRLRRFMTPKELPFYGDPETLNGY